MSVLLWCLYYQPYQCSVPTHSWWDVETALGLQMSCLTGSNHLPWAECWFAEESELIAEGSEFNVRYHLRFLSI